MLKLEGSSITLIYNIMPSPFPGMDPYLENPQFWPEVHHLLISVIAETLIPQIRPKYQVAIEKRIYEINDSGDNFLLVGIPDVIIKRPDVNHSYQLDRVSGSTLTKPIPVTVPMPETIRQAYLEIKEMETGQVITAIEILSPVNKREGEGRIQYLKKRQKILTSLTHFVEIDLLRDYEPMPILKGSVETDYRVLVSRANQRPKADLYAFNLPKNLPSFAIPLKEDDPECILNLQEVLTVIYDRYGYDYRINYTQEIIPPLDEKYQEWVKTIVSGT